VLGQFLIELTKPSVYRSVIYWKLTKPSVYCSVIYWKLTKPSVYRSVIYSIDYTTITGGLGQFSID
jgi:hypothetical protein